MTNKHLLWSKRRAIAAVLAGLAGLAGLPGAAFAVDPGVGIGALGVGVVDPGLNQPGVAGNVGGVARRSVRR